MDNSTDKIPSLPYAMSPTDYAYIVLGKPPQQTSIVRYVNSGRIPTVEVQIQVIDPRTGLVFRTSTQNWVRVPEKERTLNIQYQTNVRKIPAKEARNRWNWIAEIPSLYLPNCPKLEKLKQVERNVHTIRGKLLPLLLNSGKTYSKPVLLEEFFSKYGSSFPDISKKEVLSVVDWFIRKDMIDTGGKHPDDKRQTVIKITPKGQFYLNPKL